MNTDLQSLPWQPKTSEEARELFLALQNEASISTSPDATNQHIVAAIYTRKSKVHPNRANYSPGYQEDDAEAYARKRGWSIYKVYADIDKTGRNGKREGLRNLKRAIKAGKVDVVVIHEISRLYRNLNGLMGFVQLLIEHDVRLVSVTEHIDTESPWGMMILQVLGALAEMFVRQTSERLRRMKAARAERGLLNGRLPLGYCKGNCSTCSHPNGEGYCPNFGQEDLGDGEVPVQHPIDRYAVQLCHNLYSQGMSYKQIATHLNTHVFELPNGETAQFRTQGIRGRTDPGPFGRTSIQGIIENPTYAGMVAQYERPPLDMTD